MTSKELTRQELLQIYYNEALELLFNQENITTEWLTKIKEKFKLESWSDLENFDFEKIWLRFKKIKF